MKGLVPLRMPLAIAGAALGAAGLFASLVFLGWRIPESAAASARTDGSVRPQVEANAAFCHSFSSAVTSNASIRLAASRTEVPPAEMQAAMPAPAFADSDPPFWDGLGSLTYKITTSNPQAQSYFNQGLRLAYAFNHGEAQRAFRKAQKLDPACAMCFWGEALVLGPNINLPMQEDAVAPAFAAAQKAKALADKSSPREQVLISAISARYADDPKADRKVLDTAYAAAMNEAAVKFPDDNQIAVLYA